MKRIDSEGVGDNDGSFEVEDMEPTDWLKEVRRLQEENRQLKQEQQDYLDWSEAEKAVRADQDKEIKRLRARVAELEACLHECGSDLEREIKKQYEPDDYMHDILLEPSERAKSLLASKNSCFASSVPMPQNKNQARAMALTGWAWLRDNAPDELNEMYGTDMHDGSKFNTHINAALLFVDRVIEDLENGFVACSTCGDQEETKTLDCMSDLRAAKTALVAFINGKEEVQR